MYLASSHHSYKTIIKLDYPPGTVPEPSRAKCVHHVPRGDEVPPLVHVGILKVVIDQEACEAVAHAQVPGVALLAGLSSNLHVVS